MASAKADIESSFQVVMDQHASFLYTVSTGDACPIGGQTNEPVVLIHPLLKLHALLSARHDQQTSEQVRHMINESVILMDPTVLCCLKSSSCLPHDTKVIESPSRSDK